jgi:hypothetical protein
LRNQRNRVGKMRGLVIVLIIMLTWLATGESALEVNAATSKVQMMPWEKVNQVVPKYKKFTVKDIETGKQFQVQRRAGSHHADVQPLSAKDTSIMKQIYNGKWSWKRRAIIVISDGEKIAASMHGMPHGAGALENDFPGHFCIHFYGSTTHRTNHMDLSHKLMIYKSAGKLKPYLATANPYEVISAYLAGIKEQDQQITAITSHQPVQWKEVFSKVDNVHIGNMTVLPVEDLEGELQLSIPVVVDLYIKNDGTKRYRGNVQLIRFSQFDSWKVDSVSFLSDNELLVRNSLGQ